MSRGKSTPAQITQVALELFAQRGVHATSLQMIADNLGVSKAAVYYHFRTKEQIIQAVLKPATDGLSLLVAQARNIPSEQGRVEALVRGLAEEAIVHRLLYSVVLRDVAATAAVAHTQNVQSELAGMLVGDSKDPQRQVRVAMFLAGLVAPAVDEKVGGMSDGDVRDGIVAVGMALLAGREGEGAVSEVRV